MSINLPDNKAAKKAGKRDSLNFSELLNKDIKLRKGIGDKKKEQFYNELYTLIAAGVDVRFALEIMEGTGKKGQETVLVQQLKELLTKGSSLSEAMQINGMFTPYEYHSIQIGEESARLKEVLFELQQFYHKRLKLKRQLISALSYPSFVIVVAFGVIYFMLNNIVPMFSSVFKRFDGERPYLTQLVVRLSERFGNYFWLFALAICAVVLALFTQRKTNWFRSFSASVQLKIPLLGNTLRKIYLARFCQSMQLLISAQTPLVKSVSLVKNMIGFYPLERALHALEEKLIQGASLSASMKAFELFDKKMIALIQAAEEVNQLDVMFKKITDLYSTEVEHQTGVLGSVLEPLIILFVALFVGIILIAMYLPLFSLSTSIG